MNGAWLEAQLSAGRSIEAIARELGRDASTVAYWVNKYGLVSAHAARHAARGPIARETLEELVEHGRSVREIARAVDRSPTTVRHWLRRYGLTTRPARYAPRGTAKPSSVLRECARHGWLEFTLVGAGGFRCPRCRIAAVSERRRAVKRILVEEAGGRCARCGYDRCAAALHFHHVDPALKAFALASRGVSRALDAARLEARKCVLLCANCHAEVEADGATFR